MLTRFQIRIIRLVLRINSFMNSLPFDVYGHNEMDKNNPNIILKLRKSKLRRFLCKLNSAYQWWYIFNLILQLPNTYNGYPNNGKRLLEIVTHTFWLFAILGCQLVQISILLNPTEVASLLNRIMYLNFKAGKILSNMETFIVMIHDTNLSK